MEADFSGYATVANVKCSDGLTIMSGAFKHQDKIKVPLVWQHLHNESSNVLGHMVLEHRDRGMYGLGYFNDTPNGQHAKQMVEHGDIDSLSIFANKVAKQGSNVVHGDIKEVSLVLSGANSEAFIDFINIKHGDITEQSDDEAIMYTGVSIEHADNSGEGTVADTAEKTVKDVFDAMTEEQKNVVYYMVGEAASGGADDDDDDDTVAQSDITFEDLTEEVSANIIEHMNKEGLLVGRNVFEQGNTDTEDRGTTTLSHSQIQTIVRDADKHGSLKESFLAHADEYGITNIEYLFPDAKTLQNSPELIARRTEWVSDFIGGVKKSPFTRIKTLIADITADEARAKGYVKGTRKKDEVVKLLKRVTTPTTIYKKQKLDRDDILDITDLDVVAWIKAEMRVMLDEEIARAILVGDGREIDDEDKINEDHLRPIAYDDEMFSHQVNLASGSTKPADIEESILRSRKVYKGTGTPNLYTTDDVLTDLLLQKDEMGRRLYKTVDEVAGALRVKSIIVVEALESVPSIFAIIVNPSDYTLGADKGGQITMFDDFDIDFNQYKYLLETRISGCLTKPKSAIVIKKDGGNVVTPTQPSYNRTTRTITIPTVSGVEYLIDGSVVTGDVTITKTTDVEARAKVGYQFPHNTDNDWVYAVA